MSQVANAYVRLMTRVQVEDATSGFRCWSADFARKLPLRNLQAGGFAFLYETLFYAGELKAKVREIPNFYRGRTYGESKMGTAIVLEALWVPLRLRSSSMMRHLSGGQ
jgi:dolichol-phosphate mannosyltransferase